MSFSADTPDKISDLIEMDIPRGVAIPTAADDAGPLDLDMDPMPPADPAWLIEARQAIAGATTRPQLNEVCAPMRAWPEERKVLIRPLRDFEARCAADVYISADLTTWLQRTLRNVHSATRFGVGWYVPAGQREAAERLTRAVAKIWGESWRHGMPVAACAHLFEGLTEGLADEITKLEEAWTGAREEAHAAGRTLITPAKAGGLLARIFETSERVRGYAVLLGEEATAPLRARLATLDGAIRPLTDDTTARASMLEFS